jgi:hypothetical protein
MEKNLKQLKSLNGPNLNTYLVYLLPCLILIAGALLHYWRGYYGSGFFPTHIHADGVDDAYITYRYGWNVVHYDNLSWNESGYRRTEGFTNPLWVLASVLWSLPGSKELLYPLSVLTTVVLSIALFLLLIHVLYTRFDQSAASTMGLILVTAMPAIWLHITSGLESVVFGLGIALLAYLVIFEENRYSNILIITFLSIVVGLLRSDGFIYLIIILVAALIARSKSWKPVVVGLVVSSAMVLVWRYFTFNALLPNTAIAKLNFSLFERIPVSFKYLQFTLFNSGLAIFLILGLAGLRYERRNAVLACLLIIIGWIAYYIYMGGDWQFERHLVGMYFFTAALSAPLWREARRSSRGLLVLVLLAAGVISVFRYGERFNYLSPKYNDPWAMLGQAVEADRDRYGVLITHAAGKIPFYAGGDVIDNLGLNDPYLATFKRDPFVPGHSAGNDQAAIELAQSHPSEIYSRFSYISPNFIKGPDDISLWIDNRVPQQSVQHEVTDAQWRSVIEDGEFYFWSVITEPIRVSNPDS